MNEPNYILFSPLGMTDPIKYNYDGSMLHISRTYKPSKIILYMSREIIDCEKLDNRFTFCIEELSKSLNHNFTIEIIERPQLLNAHEFDTFYEDFMDILKNLIQTKSKDEKIIVNVSSGTPGMKSALLVLSVLYPNDILPVQVSSPNNQSNTERKPSEYDVIDNWLSNKDSSDNFENRTTIPKMNNLHSLLKKEYIKNFVLKYDYEAAYFIAKDIKQHLSEDTIKLLYVAKERLKLNQKDVDRTLTTLDYDIIPNKSSKERPLVEYLLTLKIKKSKEEYADFIRALTPIITDITEELCKIVGINLSEICTKNPSTNSLRFDMHKLQSHPELLNILNVEFNNEFKGGDVGPIQLIPLIKQYTKDSDIINYMCIIKDILKKRNLTAHEIVSVTEDWIKQNTGQSPDKILNLVKSLLIKCNIKITNDVWNSYDKMNEYIIESLNH